jgi:hypothetical protein
LISFADIAFTFNIPDWQEAIVSAMADINGKTYFIYIGTPYLVYQH